MDAFAPGTVNFQKDSVKTAVLDNHVAQHRRYIDLPESLQSPVGVASGKIRLPARSLNSTRNPNLNLLEDDLFLEIL